MICVVPIAVPTGCARTDLREVCRLAVAQAVVKIGVWRSLSPSQCDGEATRGGPVCGGDQFGCHWSGVRLQYPGSDGMGEKGGRQDLIWLRKRMRSGQREPRVNGPRWCLAMRCGLIGSPAW